MRFAYLCRASSEIGADYCEQEEMAAASLDVNFKEELSAIEQCTLSIPSSLSLD